MSENKPEVLDTLKIDSMLQKINQGNRRRHTFSVDFSKMNEKFVGRFTVKHPTQMERIHIGVVKTQLLGGVVPVDRMTDNIATIISTLDTVLIDFPEWFSVFDDEVDYDVLEEVFIKYIDWVNSFRQEPKQDTNAGDSEETEG